MNKNSSCNYTTPPYMMFENVGKWHARYVNIIWSDIIARFTGDGGCVARYYIDVCEHDAFPSPCTATCIANHCNIIGRWGKMR